jgi:hypothetical protein
MQNVDTLAHAQEAELKEILPVVQNVDWCAVLLTRLRAQLYETSVVTVLKIFD